REVGGHHDATDVWAASRETGAAYRVSRHDEMRQAAADVLGRSDNPTTVVIRIRRVSDDLVMGRGRQWRSRVLRDGARIVRPVVHHADPTAPVVKNDIALDGGV